MIFLPIEVSADQSTSQEYTEVLTPYEQNGMWGYTDRTGSIVIQPQWAVAGWYRCGTAAVCSTDGQWGIIDENGEYLVASGISIHVMSQRHLKILTVTLAV